MSSVEAERPVDLVLPEHVGALRGAPAGRQRQRQSGLRTPDRSAEELLGVLRCRRADGPEVALDEFPLARQWTDPATVRAEEMALSAPDGRSVTTLVNATPIRSADGQVESMVVTLQDLAPLEELERLRAEFLGMVSRELRAPLTSIKGSTATVLGTSPAVTGAELLQFFRIIDEQADHMRALISDLLDAGSIDLRRAGVLRGIAVPEPFHPTIRNACPTGSPDRDHGGACVLAPL